MSSGLVSSKLFMAVATLSAMCAITIWLLRQEQERKKGVPKQKQQYRTIESPNREPIGEKLWKSFEDAVAAIQNVHHLNNGDKLILYGLYKQVVVGDAPDRLMPSSFKTWNIMAEQAKFAAWNDVRGMDALTALQHYVKAVQEFTSENCPTEDMSEEGSSADDYGVGPGFAAVSRPVDLHGQDTYISDGTLESQLLENASDFTALQSLLSSEQQPAVNINHADATGQTALHLAADAGQLDCVVALVEAGCDIHAADRDGISVLQAAVIAGHAETVQYLLRKGANPDQADLDGDTPRSCADAHLQHLF